MAADSGEEEFEAMGERGSVGDMAGAITVVGETEAISMGFSLLFSL
jgi:hypothetical protein